MNRQTNEELIKQLNESHECFARALIESDGMLAMLAYSNYVKAMALLFHRIQPEFMRGL